MRAQSYSRIPLWNLHPRHARSRLQRVVIGKLSWIGLDLTFEGQKTQVRIGPPLHTGGGVPRTCAAIENLSHRAHRRAPSYRGHPHLAYRSEPIVA